MDSSHHLPRQPQQNHGPDPRASAISLALSGVIARADVPALCARLRALLVEQPSQIVVCDVAGVSDPDCSTIEALSRLQLTAKRMGTELWVNGASDDLHDLLALSGLCEVVGMCGGYASS